MAGARMFKKGVHARARMQQRGASPTPFHKSTAIDALGCRCGRVQTG